LNAALNANPIGLVVIAVAALAAGIVIAYKNSETFRNICQAAFDAVKVAVDAVAGAFRSLLAGATAAFNWVKSHWAVAQFAFGPIAVAITAIANNFDAIKDAAKAAFDAIASGIAAVTGAIQSAIGWVERLLGKISAIHMPDLNPFSLPAPAAAGVGLTRTRAGGAVATGGAAGMTFNIYGAVDPEGTARAISRIMRAHDRRHGRA
jgi:phage-related minor tail protein